MPSTRQDVRTATSLPLNALTAGLQPACAFDLIDLSAAQPVAAGSERDIYQHPHDPGLLIKIINGVRANEPGRRRPWHKRFHREQKHRVFLTELAEYVSTSVHAGGLQGNTLLARISGLVNTTLGLGLAVEKIVDDHGRLAPTLQQLTAEQGYNEGLRRQVRDFFVALTDAHIIFNDVSARNIVVGRNNDGAIGLYLVDGYGSKQLLPIYAWSKTLNRQRLLRKHEEMAGKMARLGARAPATAIAHQQ